MFFSQLSSQHQLELVKRIKQKTLKQGHPLFKEGDQADCAYILLEGEVTIERESSSAEDGVFSLPFLREPVQLKQIQPGQVIGESCFFESGVRAETVMGASDCILASIRYDDLFQIKKTDFVLYQRITELLAYHLTQRLRKCSHLLTEKTRQNHNEEYKSKFYSSFLLCVLCATAFFYFLDNYIQYLYSLGFTTKFYVNKILIFFMPFLFFWVQHRPPLNKLGFTFLGARQALVDSIWVSSLLCGTSVLVKLFLIFVDPSFHLHALFAMKLNSARMWGILLIYAIICFPQEVVARGMLQGGFNILFKNQSPRLSIVLSNFIFMTVHVSLLGYTASFLVFLTGLAWGWMYSRNKTLLGVTLSHVFVGAFGLFVVGFS